MSAGILEESLGEEVFATALLPLILRDFEWEPFDGETFVIVCCLGADFLGEEATDCVAF